MKITFLGATKTVTGSNFLVEAAGKRFLVDCGMWQGNAELEMQNAEEFEFDPNQITFCEFLVKDNIEDALNRLLKEY